MVDVFISRLSQLCITTCPIFGSMWKFGSKNWDEKNQERQGSRALKNFNNLAGPASLHGGPPSFLWNRPGCRTTVGRNLIHKLCRFHPYPNYRAMSKATVGGYLHKGDWMAGQGRPHTLEHAAGAASAHQFSCWDF